MVLSDWRFSLMSGATSLAMSAGIAARIHISFSQPVTLTQCSHFLVAHAQIQLMLFIAHTEHRRTDTCRKDTANLQALLARIPLYLVLFTTQTICFTYLFQKIKKNLN